VGHLSIPGRGGEAPQGTPQAGTNSFHRKKNKGRGESRPIRHGGRKKGERQGTNLVSKKEDSEALSQGGGVLPGSPPSTVQKGRIGKR